MVQVIITPDGRKLTENSIIGLEKLGNLEKMAGFDAFSVAVSKGEIKEGTIIYVVENRTIFDESKNTSNICYIPVKYIVSAGFGEQCSLMDTTLDNLPSCPRSLLNGQTTWLM